MCGGDFLLSCMYGGYIVWLVVCVGLFKFV